MGESSGALHLPDDGMEGAVGVLRGAEVAQPNMRLGSQVLQQCGREPRLADAGFTREEYHLPFTALGLGPAPQEQFKFFFASDQSGYIASMERFEMAFDRAWSQSRESSHRTGDALEPSRSKFL